MPYNKWGKWYPSKGNYRGYRGGSGNLYATLRRIEAIKKRQARAAGLYADRRRAAMSGFMKNLNQAFPRYGRSSAMDVSGPVTVSGVGDYRFSKRMRPSLGARAGAWLGDKAQGLFKRFTGLGDYQSASGAPGTIAPMQNDPPIVDNVPGRGVVFKHREFLGDMQSAAVAAGYVQQLFNVNPGDPNTFPWLSLIANHFQEWEPLGIGFEFVTMSSDTQVASTIALGQVIVGSQYNNDLPAFTNKYEIENTEYSSSCKPSCSMMHWLECDPRQRSSKIMNIAPNGVLPPGAVANLYNLCKTTWAVNAVQAPSANIGELWITYNIVLYKPLLENSNAQNLPLYGRFGNTTVNGSGAALIAGTGNLFGLSAPVTAGNFQFSTFGTNMSSMSISNLAGESWAGKRFFLQVYYKTNGVPGTTQLIPYTMGSISGGTVTGLPPNTAAGPNSGNNGMTANTSIMHELTWSIVFVPSGSGSVTFSISTTGVTSTQGLPAVAGSPLTTTVDIFCIEVQSPSP